LLADKKNFTLNQRHKPKRCVTADVESCKLAAAALEDAGAVPPAYIQMVQLHWGPITFPLEHHSVIMDRNGVETMQLRGSAAAQVAQRASAPSPLLALWG
jgi:hypothetical protein